MMTRVELAFSSPTNLYGGSSGKVELITDLSKTHYHSSFYRL